MTAVGVESQITEALLQRLAALTLSPVLPIANPNVTFTPPASGPYLQANILRSPTETVGISRWDERTGIFQVDVVYAAKDGLIKPTQIADQIAVWFKRGTRLLNGAVRVDIYETPEIGTPLTDTPYVRTPVTIRYRVFTP